VLAFHFPPGLVRTSLIRRSIGVLIPSMLPFLNFHTGMTIDYGAHAGGAIGGALIGAGLLVTWPRGKSMPGGRWTSVVAIIVGAGGLLSGVTALTESYAYRQILAKDFEVQRLWLAATKGADEFTFAYPKDPRSHIAYATYLLDNGKFVDAEAEARLALEQRVVLDKILPPIFRAEAVSELAIAQSREGRKDEALTTAEPICETKSPFQPFLIKEGLCSSNHRVP
jgi:hypothetical protein